MPSEFATSVKVVANGWGLSQTHHGGYAQKAQLTGDWFVKIPPPLSCSDLYPYLPLDTGGE